MRPTDPLAVRTPVRLHADPGRVLARLFVPGQGIGSGRHSRAAAVVKRILRMSDTEVHSTVEEILEDFTGRHRGFRDTLQENFRVVAHRLAGGPPVSAERQLLVGACFTNEYSIEAAALFNPSMVLHPDQTGLEAGDARFILSLRAVGEGHISSIEFRTGIVGADGSVTIDDPGTVLVPGAVVTHLFERELFRGKLDEMGEDSESASFVLDHLPERFTAAELEGSLAALEDQIATRIESLGTIGRIRWLTACNYDVEFPADSALGERVLWPAGPSETNGMEDARFVRFTEEGGAVTYYATYTAFNGTAIAPQLIETHDFRRFRITQLAGPAAQNKGMALFPRRIGGRYAALSRWDRENNAIVLSDDCRSWGEAVTIQSPAEPWEVLQLGNCGSPIETPEGWLVLTHGVGPLRSYSIGVVLLDLDDPTRVVGRLPEPLLSPDKTERDGYVPNVVYSCGALLHGNHLVLPYGISDAAVGVALIDLDRLLEQLVPAA